MVPRIQVWLNRLRKVKVTQSRLTLCHPVNYTVHGILQARILEWGAILFSRGCSQLRDWTQVSRTAGGFFTSWATRVAHKGMSSKGKFINTESKSVAAWGQGRGRAGLQNRSRKPLGLLEMAILIILTVSWVYTYVKTDQTVYFKCLSFSVLQLIFKKFF